MNAKQKMEQQHSIEQILSRLENAQQEDEELNEMDPAIFKYYKGTKKDDDEEIDDVLDEQKLINKIRY
jgi:CCR4-NOT transcriptional regulation complex NOT5 subunit